MNSSALIQKVWNFCHTLRDDGVGYGDYLEQLTYLLFLKLAHEYAQEPYHRDTHIPKGYDWSSLKSKTGQPLEFQYLTILNRLGREAGMLGAIFFKAQNKIQDPAKLSRLVQMIDAENWIGLDADTKGDLYEGLLQKNAEDTKSGAGQYFTPRPLIQAMVECVRPEPMKTIADPACGTGGFFLGAYQWKAPETGRHYLRFAFAAEPDRHDPARTLDDGIVRALWMTPEELLDARDRHRSPLVWQVVADHLAGHRFPLSLLRHPA